MQLVELLDRANKGYPEGTLCEYYDPGTGKLRPGSGDTLAQFVVLELTETFDPEASEEDQITEAIRALERGAHDLLRTIWALRASRDDGA